jgi:large subunit ribosomal protein L28
MARKCQLSGKSHQHGNRVSHAKNRKRHIFKANIQTKRVFIAEENRFVRLRLSARMIRTIDKVGLNGALKMFGLSMADIAA